MPIENEKVKEFLKVGEKPINLAGKPLNENKLVTAFQLLDKGLYEENAKKVAEKLNAEQGIVQAGNLLENYIVRGLNKKPFKHKGFTDLVRFLCSKINISNNFKIMLKMI